MSATIVVIDDSHVDRKLVTTFLRERGYEALGAAGGDEGLALCRDVQPDVIVLDLVQGIAGLGALDSIRRDLALSDTPVIIMTSQDSAEVAAEGIERGADDYVRKPSHVELLARIETVLRRRAVAGNLARRAAQLATSASKDIVTGLPNQLLLEQELGRLMASARRHSRPMCVAIVDVDGFTTINEEHGRAGGDRALRGVGAALDARLRESDFVGRWGSDEFLVLLPDTAADGAERVTEDLRAAVEEAGPPTVSIGWSLWSGGSGVQLIARAEQALSDAKRAGPNAVRNA